MGIIAFGEARKAGGGLEMIHPEYRLLRPGQARPVHAAAQVDLAAVIGGFILSCPWIFLQLWTFVAAGLFGCADAASETPERLDQLARSDEAQQCLEHPDLHWDLIIVDEAHTGYDVVVLGRRGISGVREFFFGSVSSKIVNHARDCTVWVVK